MARAGTAFVVGGILGVIAGAGGMLIAFPFIFPPPVVSEKAPTTTAAAVKQVGTFQFDENAPGRDRIHYANGSGAVFKNNEATVIRFNDDFKAGPGPNFWIYLNTAPVGEAQAFKADADRARLAPLKAFTGGQNYAVPAGIDIGIFHTVTIWCESFSVYIGSAALPNS